MAADIINMVADFIENRNGSKSTISTEEMAAGILKYNRKAKLNNKKRILMSMDVKGLYPNLEIEEVLKIIKEMVGKSGLNFEGVDWVEVGKHLAICVSRQELEELNLSEVVPKRKGADRSVTMAYLDGGDKNKKNVEKWAKLWNMPRRLPNEVEKANMISKLIEIVTKEVMSNHFYSVGDTIRKQTDGGPIGLQLTGAIARIVMLWWDDQFLGVASTAGIVIDMYERFIDDSNLVTEVIEAGWKFCSETRRMIFQEDLVQNESTVEDDRRTALVIKDIANSVHPMIQME